MKHSTYTKHAFFLSVLALMLCFVMLLGTTFAWFTDSASSDNNTIVAGNLDVELYHESAKTAEEEVTASTKLFDDVDSLLWEPEAIAYEKFTVKNAGTLAFKYKFSLNATNATVVDGVSFASVLKVAVVDESFVSSRESVKTIADDQWKDLASFTLPTAELAKNESDSFCIVIYWKQSALDNTFNMNNGKTQDSVKIDVGVSLVATQLDSEGDSFGPDYDGGAEYPYVSSAPVTFAPNAGGTYEEETLQTPGENSVETKLPAGLIEDLVDNGVTSASLVSSEPKTTVDPSTQKTVVTFGEITLLDQNGNEIDLTNNDQPIMVTLFVGKSLAGQEVAVYHDDAFLATATVDAEGYITYEALHFCEVTVETDSSYSQLSEGIFVKAGETYTYYISNAEGLETMNKMMLDKKAGRDAVVNLIGNIDFSGKTWTPVDSHADIAFELAELNGNGHTISNLTIEGQAMFKRFAGTGDVVIRDITFDNAKVDSTENGTSTDRNKIINTSILTVQTYQNTLLDNVDIKNSSIMGGYKVAPLIATVYNENESSITCTVKNCDVSNTVVTATMFDYFTCGMISFVYTTNNDYVEYENCSITDVQLKAVNVYNYHANIHYTSADTDDQINEHPGVTVTNVTFENITLE